MPRPAFGRYLPRDSFLHRLDPRTKLVGVALLMGAVFFLEGGTEYALMLGLIALGARSARLRWREWYQGLSAVALLMAISFFLQLSFTPGEPLGRLGPVTFTRPGLFRGLTLAGRLAFLAVLSALLGFTTASAQLAEGLYLLGRPLERLGLPMRRLALVLGVGLRFVPTILEQGQQIMNAQRARGIDFSEGNPLRRARRLLAVFLPLLSACLRRAEELALAMDARGFRLDAPRSRWQPLRMTTHDWLTLAGVGALTAWVIWA